MKTYEIILLMIHELGGSLSGKTKMHKLCYFYSVISKKQMGFKPHYYGPYSPAVENALDELEGMGLIRKTTEPLGENPDGFEMKRYSYKVTKYGLQVIDTMADTQGRTQLKMYIEKVKDVGLPTTTDISIAAKAYYILDRENKPLTDGEIHKKAKNFNWDISSTSIHSAANFLKEFELISIGSHA